MTKDQGLYNKPSAAVHPGASAAGTLPQYNMIVVQNYVVVVFVTYTQSIIHLSSHFSYYVFSA